jgi:hypothetical protein
MGRPAPHAHQITIFGSSALRDHATVAGEVVQYEDVYPLCYIRGPEGLLIGLAEELRPGKPA